MISTNPKGDTQADKGAEVTYTLSKGQNNVAVPWVVGQTQGTATENLRGAGFEVEIVEDYNDEYDEGLVYWQDPTGDDKVKKGSTITLYVSLGTELIDVPNVVGMSVSDARATLMNAGFNVTETKEYSGDAIVMSQSESGQAKEGATVNITAQEPEPEPEPEPSSSSSSEPSSSSSADDEDEEDGEEDL